MMEIVRITDGDYKQYEELLLQRDLLEKEASAYHTEYIREFGELITEVFREKLECIALKKAIGFCLTVKNHGDAVDPSALKDYLDVHMSAYYAELHSMLQQNKAAKQGTPISDYQYSRIKKLYRRLAKLLHPDISPVTGLSPRLMELFQEVLAAYKCNDLKRLQELEVLVQATLEELGIESTDIVIENIESKIAELEVEINTIVTTEPYLYKELLADAFAVTEKKNALEKELEEYKSYRAELQKHFEALTA